MDVGQWLGEGSSRCTPYTHLVPDETQGELPHAGGDGEVAQKGQQVWAAANREDEVGKCAEREREMVVRQRERCGTGQYSS